MGGNSTVTFLNTKTSNRFTYRVKSIKNKSNPENPIFFVKVLTNPDLYQFIGSIINTRFKYSKKSKISDDAQSIRVFQYVFAKLQEGKLDDCVEIYHEGKCGRCNRPLTVPDSIKIGIGPECLKMMSNPTQLKRQLKIDKILE